MSAWNIIINANQRNGYTYTYTSLKGVGNWVEHTSAGIKTWGKLASSVNGSILLATDAVSSNIPSVSTNTGYLYVSTDGGNNWSEKTDAGNRLWSSLSVSSDGTKMIASVENGNIYISSDTGSNWVPDSSAGSRSWNSIATSSDNSKIITALTDSNVYTSDDSGSSWEYRGAIGGTTGTLKFKLSTSAWNADPNPPVINDNNSFTTLNTTTSVDGSNTIVEVFYLYLEITGTDGLRFFGRNYASDSSLEIIDLANIPLSNSNSQFAGFKGTYGSNVGKPTILENTNLFGCFSSTTFNADISDWNFTNVVNMSNMFASSTFNNAVNSWDVSNVTDISSMFSDATNFNQPLNDWNVSNVSNFSAMLSSASEFNQPLDSWNTSNVTSFGQMFSFASKFNQDISSWNVSNGKAFFTMFSSAFAFNQPLNSWNISNATSLFNMFGNATAFDQDLSSWNTSKVTTIGNMFFGASNFNQDISSWNTSSVKKMENAFYNAANFNQNISGWNTSKVERSYSMFDGASVFNQDLGSWDISENENMTDMFTDAGLSVTNYSNILNGWAAQAPSIQSNVTLGASPTQYNAGAVASRNTLTGTYSWNITDGGLGLNTELFISGYGEGSSNNKYLQIYNPTNSDINLDNYKFKRCGNGCTDWEYTFPFPSSTIINSGEKITIANNSADTGILACADIPDILDPNNSRQSLCSFNGDDAIGLFKDDTLIDIIGEVGPDPGSGWEVAGVSNATANHTLVRKQTISSGNTDWSASAGTNANDSEWVVFPNDTNKACSYTSDYP